MGLKNLPHIHARRHTQWIKQDVNSRAVFHMWHILDRNNPRDHTLVAVAASHFVAGLQLALHGHEDLDHLQHTWRKFVAALNFFDLGFEARLNSGSIRVQFLLEHFHLSYDVVALHHDLPPLTVCQLRQNRFGHLYIGAKTLWPLGGNLAEN